MMIKLGNKSVTTWGLLSCALITSTSAFADSCKTLLNPVTTDLYFVTMVSINKNSVVSYAKDFISYYPAKKGKEGGKGLPPRWVSENWQSPTGYMEQLFNDRYTSSDQQPFSATNFDFIQLVIPVADSPTVEIILKSWGNAVTSFTASCTSDGFIQGATSDARYTLLVTHTCSGGCG